MPKSGCKLRIVSTHPIQYQVPWFKKLATIGTIDLKVYYALLPSPEAQGVGFNIAFSWDIPLLEGYRYEVLANKKKKPKLNRYFASSIPTIYSAFAQDLPDVVIITGWNALPLVQAWWACERLNLRKIMRGESNALKPPTILHRLAHTNFLRRFEAFLAIGKSNREFYVRNGISEELIFNSCYFVDNDRFGIQASAERPRRNLIRQKFGVPETSICFLFAGKLQPKKRIIDLLSAMEIISQKSHSNIHLLIVGSGQQMNTARELVKTRNLAVSFAGFLNQTEITQAYVAADCLVLPSDYGETWGLVVNEAMACDLPAIVSDRVGCAPDLIQEGVTGAVFQFGNVKDLAEKMVRFAADPENLKMMGKQAKNHIAMYSVDAAVAGTLAAVDFVMADQNDVIG